MNTKNKSISEQRIYANHRQSPTLKASAQRHSVHANVNTPPTHMAKPKSTTEEPLKTTLKNSRQTPHNYQCSGVPAVIPNSRFLN